ncbi:globin domain-containing protein [Amycolatopsis sp.]|uniref:globin domain-containing protein n=1 Tax=Amycolatopsis sp. TaxID=37632 RepID=UPI0026342098|nr:globin domain-containing protein [Amycolatopsis sp.]
MAQLIRESFAAVEARAQELSQYFYGALFVIAPDTRNLFPVNMTTQRDRLLRALVYVVQMVDRPDELVTFLGQLGRDHRKFDVLARHYDAVGMALISALKRFLGKRWTTDVEIAWTTAYGLIAKTMRESAAAATGPAWWWATVTGHKRIGNDLAMVLVRPEWLFPYRAGNYVSVEIPQRRRLWRYLSPANAPREDGTIEFHVRAVEGGWVSRPIVHNTRVGDVWRLGPALGALSVHHAEGLKLLMIGGGTGLAPLMSILEDLTRWKRNPSVQLFFGGREPEDLYALERLRTLEALCPWLTVTPVTEKATVSGGYQGTLVKAVTQSGKWTEHQILVSGSPEMIRVTIAQLLDGGADLSKISYDPFTLD